MTLKNILDVAKTAGAIDIVGQIMDLAVTVQANVARGVIVLADGDQADFDAIHAEALAANSELDAKLAAASQR